MLYRFERFSCKKVYALTHNMVYASYPKEFNDPFEGYCICRSQFEGSLKEIPYSPECIKKITTTRGVVCFSKERGSIKNVLMWSHYADSHKGFCIEYKDEAILALQGIKSNEVLRVDDVQYNAPCVVEDISDRYDIEPAFHKASCWSYEREFRVVFSDEGLKSLGDNVALVINAIYLGCESYRLVDSPEYKCLMEFIHLHKIPCYQMVASYDGSNLAIDSRIVE